MTADAPFLRLEGVRKRYGRRAVLDGVSFGVGRGQVVALLGGNGAGKTTTLRCILGVTSFEGGIEVDGMAVTTRGGREVRRRIGYMPQLPALSPDDTCEGALAFTAELRRLERGVVVEALDRVNLLAERRRRVGDLSGGMRQRLALAAALLGGPPLLLLDEPTASLDAESRVQFGQAVRDLRDEGCAVLLSTHHYAGLDELVDGVLILKEGALAFEGSMGELLRRFRVNRWVVNLNGDAPADFMVALAGAGIGEERVARAAAPWDEILSGVGEEEGDAS